MIGGGELPGGELSDSGLPGGQLIGGGELPCSELSDSGLPAGQLIGGGELPGGELSGGELSSGRLSGGELSGGRLSGGRLSGAPSLPCARCAFTWLGGLSKQLYVNACVLVKRNEPARERRTALYKSDHQSQSSGPV